MIILYCGVVGSGKTLSAVYECYKYYRAGYKVYSNIKLNFPHTPMTHKVLFSMIESKEQLQDAVILLDEIHIVLDSRSSMNKKNKSLTYFILQTRKRNVRLLGTSQHLHQCDKRLRDTIDIIVFCRNLSNQTSTVADASLKTFIQQESIYQWKEGAAPKVKVIHGNPIYPLFDTREIVGFDDDTPPPSNK